jgi:hypothetical protein
MTISPPDAWVLRRLLAGQVLNGQIATLADPWQAMASHLDGLPLPDRSPAWSAMLAARPERNDVIMALATIDPLAPQPAPQPRQYATAVRLSAAGTSWDWDGWLPRHRVIGIAAGEGDGKTRFNLDLDRRVWHTLPWPDGQAMTLPPRMPSLWVCADGQHDEIAETLPDLGLPPEAIIFPAPPDDRYDHVNLDLPETWDWIRDAVTDVRPWRLVIDSLTYATTLDLCEQKAIARLKTPLVSLAQDHHVNVFLSLHVSREGQALGRRVRGITRTLMHLECPDPDKPERLRLWVEKSYGKKPPALGVTIEAGGNKYDFTPPPKIDRSKGGRTPERRDHARQFIIDELTKRNDCKARDVCSQYEAAGGSKGTFWNARDDMVLAGELECGGKPLVMHLVAKP